MIQRNNPKSYSLPDFGKIPPQANDMELSVLGVLMTHPDAMNDVISILNPEMFYRDAHQKIFASCLKVFKKINKTDLVVVTEDLRSNNELESCGGPLYITKLCDASFSASMIEHYALIVKQKYLQREYIRVSSELQNRAYDDTFDVAELAEYAEMSLLEISDKIHKKEPVKLSKLVDGVIDIIQKLINREISLTGIPTGFVKMDRVTGGFKKKDLIIIAGRPGMGKCFGKGTRILMYDGNIKNVEDIVMGDLLMGNDSTPRYVLSLGRGREQMYKVKQLHGIDYRINESHILSLKRSRNEGGHKNGDVLNIELKHYLEQSNKWKTNYKGYKESIDFPYQDVPIDPYLLGLWLGDGSSAKSTIHNPDKEIINYLNEYATAKGIYVTAYEPLNKCGAYTITGGRSQAMRDNSFQSELRKQNLLNNKHIPHIYLANNKNIRLSLLAGLIDSDGYINPSGTIEITNKYEHLARQIKFLCDSLGYRTSFNSKTGCIKTRNFVGQYWRIRFNGNVDEIPCLVKRKQAKAWTDGRNWKATGVIIEKDVIDDYYGFEIDGNHLFLLEDCTVVHNTALALQLAKNTAELHNEVGFFSCEMGDDSLARRYLSNVSGRSNVELLTAKCNIDHLLKTSEQLLELGIYIDDTSNISLSELRSKTRKLILKYGIRMVIVDYLQLMKGEGKSREQEISFISRGLKAIAKDLDVPVVALSQINRESESRKDKRPQLSDLRESGAIEQDADMVLFVYRPAYYKIRTMISDGTEISTEGLMMIDIAKNRNGATGEFNLKHNISITEIFEEPESF